MSPRAMWAGGCRPPQRPPRPATHACATLAVAILAGCGGVSGGKTPPTRVPDADVSPARVELAGTCGATPTTVTVANRGDAPLRVTALTLAGDGWAFASGQPGQAGETGAPSTLAPGDARAVPLVATAGEGTLTVETDDPERPRVVVTLRATADAPPRVVWTAPAEESALPAEGSVALRVLAGDDESPPDALAVTWALTLAGADAGEDLATGNVDAAGRAAWDWPAETRPAGPLVLQARVVDPCGNVGESSLHVCQDGPWSVPALTYDAWRTEGDATLDPAAGTLDLGPGVGAAFDATTTFDGDRLALTLTLTGSGAALAIVARDGARTSAWGSGAFGVEAPGGAGLPGWALVLDTAQDGDEPCGVAPALAWVVDGELSAPRGCAPLPPLDDGAPHALALDLVAGHARVDVDGVRVLDVEAPGVWAGEAFLGVAGRGPWRVNALEAVDHTCPR